MPRSWYCTPKEKRPPTRKLTTSLLPYQTVPRLSWTDATLPRHTPPHGALCLYSTPVPLAPWCTSQVQGGARLDEVPLGVARRGKVKGSIKTSDRPLLFWSSKIRGKIHGPFSTVLFLPNKTHPRQHQSILGSYGRGPTLLFPQTGLH